MLCFAMGVSAKVLAQQEKVDLDFQNVSVKQLFLEIQKQTNLSFIFSMEQVVTVGNVSVKAEQEAVESVLKRVFRDTKLTFEFSGNLIIVRTHDDEKEKPKEIKIVGKVVDEKGQPLPGVTIHVKGYTVGTSTDKDGKYTFRFVETDKKRR